MHLFGREASVTRTISDIRHGNLPIEGLLDDKNITHRLALENLVLSPIVARFVQQFDRDTLFRQLDILPFENKRSIVERSLALYIQNLKAFCEEEITRQAEDLDPLNLAARGTREIRRHFGREDSILKPIESAFQAFVNEGIITVANHMGEDLSLQQWSQELWNARFLLLQIASLRREDSDRTVLPARRSGELQRHIRRDERGIYNPNLEELAPRIPNTSRSGRGCPANTVDREGEPTLKQSLIFILYKTFTDLVAYLGEQNNN